MTYEELKALDSITCEVTQDDIDNGRRAVSSACPIALAINRTLGLEPRSSIVGLKDFNLGEINVHASHQSHFNQTFSHTPESGQFVMDFDDGKKVEPATFILKRWPQ